ncbi:MAG TPA: hypothetical protein VKB80_24065 [Kofleriaceae bacterium]|nr:hypothetical protein [Kofleriaceae bacterium]
MKTKTNALVPVRKRRTILALIRDRRGAQEYVTNLVLICALALAGIAAVKALSGQVSKASDNAGKRIESEVK